METNKVLKVQDISLKKGMPASSKFFTSEEYMKLYPGGIRRSKNFLFCPGMSVEMPEKEAFALVAKYENLRILDQNLEPLSFQDDLDAIEKMKDLQNVAGTYGIDLVDKTKDQVKQAIREARAAGIDPIPMEKYLDIKKNAPYIRNNKINFQKRIDGIDPIKNQDKKAKLQQLMDEIDNDNFEQKFKEIREIFSSLSRVVKAKAKE